MGPEWITVLVVGLGTLALAIVKGLWGTDKPQEDTVEHAEQDIKLDDGKTDQERLDDLGL
jgi:hypothetical protein